MTKHPVESSLAETASLIEASGLFDRHWYVGSYPEAGESAGSLEHFCSGGRLRALQPNPYFDTPWYAKTYGDEFLPGEAPVLHYIRRGERENAWPSPHFDPEWYRETYAIGDESPLRHYLRHRASGAHSPLPVFDAVDYVAAYPECLAEGPDPYLHSLAHPVEPPQPLSPGDSPLAKVVELLGGDFEAGDIPDPVAWEAVKNALDFFVPFIPVDEDWYFRQYPDVAAAVQCGQLISAQEHFIHWGFSEGRVPTPPDRKLPKE